VVFEDAPAGIRAGNAAGATTIGILETHSKEALEEAGADYIISGLDKVTVFGDGNGKFTLKFEILEG
jgi:beta-phosphoglucomutase-like phosphatase (HAD superfamily)